MQAGWCVLRRREFRSETFCFLISVCDGIGGAVAAVGDRAVVAAQIVESDDSLRTFTQTRHHCTAERLAEEVDVPAFVERVNGAAWGVLSLVGGPSCQPPSQLGSAKAGFADGRASPIDFLFGPATAGLQECPLQMVGRLPGCLRKWPACPYPTAGRSPGDLGPSLCTSMLLIGVGFNARASTGGLDVEKLKSRPGVEVARPGTAAVDLTVIRYKGSLVPLTWSPGCGGQWSYRGETGARPLVPLVRLFLFVPRGTVCDLHDLLPSPRGPPS